MPDGEVYTAPVEDTATGQIYFDMPMDFDGHLIKDVLLVFEKGEVAKATAKKGEKSLKSLLDADNGSRRLGEFGIGINYRQTQPLGHIALDEKIGGTIHLALGFSPPDTGGNNTSAIHFDLLKDLRREGRVIADGNVLMENGRLLLKYKEFL